MTFKKILKSLSKKEWKFILIISLISILLVSIPYIYGLINKPIDTTYNPIQGFSSGDKEVYNSYIEQIKQGNFLLKDLYTSENQNKVTLNIMWLSTGLFAKFFNLSNSLSFYLIQIFSIPFLFISIYSLLVLVWKSKIKRKIAFLFSIFSAGFGFLFVGIPKFESDYIINHPMDIWVSEAFTFTTIINSPHFIISLMLIILIFIFLYLSIENKNYKQSLIAGTLSLILFQFHPYHLPTILCVIFAYTILYSLKNKEKLLDNFKYPLILILTSSPSIIYHLIILKIDPISLAKSHQNICITPKLITVLLSYGFLLIGAVTYIWIFRNKKIKNIKLFLIIWFLVQFLLLYAPTQLQRRLSEGLHIPISILTILLFFYH